MKKVTRIKGFLRFYFPFLKRFIKYKDIGNY